MKKSVSVVAMLLILLVGLTTAQGAFHSFAEPQETKASNSASDRSCLRGSPQQGDEVRFRGVVQSAASIYDIEVEIDEVLLDPEGGLSYGGLAYVDINADPSEPNVDWPVYPGDRVEVSARHYNYDCAPYDICVWIYSQDHPYDGSFKLIGDDWVDIWVYEGDGTTHCIDDTIHLCFAMSGPMHLRLWAITSDGQRLIDEWDDDGTSWCMAGTVGPPPGEHRYRLEGIENGEVIAWDETWIWVEECAGCEPDLTVYSPQVDGCSVTINGVVTSPCGDPVERINWDWGDGTSNNSWFPAEHTYDDSGTYNVTVTAYSAAGYSATDTKQVNITNCGDTTPPNGRITSPTDYAFVRACPLTIEAEADDDESGVDLVEFHAFYDAAWHHLGNDSTRPYSWNWECASVPDQDVLLTIHVWDNAGNEVMDPGGYVHITLDRSLPSITDIAASPDSISKDGCLPPNTSTVSANVFDVSDVAWAEVHYRLKGRSWYPPKLMNVSGSTYSAEVGPFPEPGTVEYYVKAVDKADNPARSGTRTVVVHDCVSRTQYRGLWLWDGGAVADTPARTEFFDFAQAKGITTVYVHCQDYLGHGETAEETLKQFIAEAIDVHGLEVQLLMGEHRWVVEPGYGTLPSLVEQAIDLTSELGADHRPVALHLDVEPHSEEVPEWDDDRATTIYRYLAMLEDVQQMLDASESPLALVVDIAFWYDKKEYEYHYQGVTRPLSEHAQHIADQVVLMDYRGFAGQWYSDGIIANAKNEISYAESIGKTAVIGVETNCGLWPEKLTFCKEGEEALDRELGLTVNYYSGKAGFGGVAIHDYRAYRRLVSPTVYVPIILRD